jgi:hypothetical protein
VGCADPVGSEPPDPSPAVADDDDAADPPPDPPAALCVVEQHGWLARVGVAGVDDDRVDSLAAALFEGWTADVPICHDTASAYVAALNRVVPAGGSIVTWDGVRLLASATYEIIVEVSWSEETHPNRIPGPADFPHFSWVGGGSHRDGTVLWRIGEPASPGVRRMALAGNTTTFEEELQALADDTGDVARTLRWQGEGFGDPPGSRGNGFFAPSVLRGEFVDLVASHPRLTLTSMLGPSTDWFVATPPEGLLLVDEEGWAGSTSHDLRPLDGGVMELNELNPWRLTDCSDAPEYCSPFTTPQDPIAWLEPGSFLGDAVVGSFALEPFITPAPVLVDEGAAAVLDELTGR